MISKTVFPSIKIVQLENKSGKVISIKLQLFAILLSVNEIPEVF